MKKMLVLSDRIELEPLKILELYLSELECRCEIENTNDFVINFTERVQGCRDFDAFFLEITSTDSVSWDLAKQLRDSEEVKNAPIVAMLTWAPNVVGPNYEVWEQHHKIFNSHLVWPVSPEQLKWMITEELWRG